MSKIIDITGQKFHRLTVLDFVKYEDNAAWWRVRCDCGKEKVMKRSAFAYGAVKSCGCLKKELQKAGYRYGIFAPPPASALKWKGIKEESDNQE